MAASVYIPLRVYEGSVFPTSLLTFVICRLFEESHSDVSEMIPRCGFDLSFSGD